MASDGHGVRDSHKRGGILQTILPIVSPIVAIESLHVPENLNRYVRAYL